MRPANLYPFTERKRSPLSPFSGGRRGIFYGVTVTAPSGSSGKRAALRALLSDCLWHTQEEMREAGGWRYGARLYEIRRGVGGPALVVESSTPGEGDNRYLYRAVGETEVEAPSRIDWRKRALEAESQLLQLRYELERAPLVPVFGGGAV